MGSEDGDVTAQGTKLELLRTWILTHRISGVLTKWSGLWTKKGET